ncbi:MAG: 3-phosphoglycerate dehydrogenase [Bacteroidales bacterium]|nr:3-phosphoglycerate dehydrogenase [Bacteroidales bacterium]MBN2818321.1 3-phosphoglycerate dehydrogenase [Bacteroidales bacterium]
MAKILVATEKPFAAIAVNGIKEICDNAGFELVLLEKYTDKKDLIAAACDVDAIIIRSDKIDKEVLDAGKNLKIVVRAGAGYDNVDLEAATANNVVVMNTPGQNSNAVAELAVGMMIYLNRNGFNGSAGTELRGKKLGIHGYGHIGKILAHIGKGLGMKVYAHDPFIDRIIIENDGVVCEEDLGTLYSKCQYISVNIPANNQTKGSLNKELLSKMPEGATLVNTARKEIIDEAGLLQVFANRKDFRYISDIAPDCKTEIEEKYAGRYFFTPKKMGAQTAEANINAGLAAAKQIVGYITDGDTTFKVN